MKKTLTLLTLVLSIFIFSQELEILDGDYTYTKVIEINKPKKEIYSVLKKWLNNATSKSKYVIDQDDPEIGIISFNERLPEMRYTYIQSTHITYKVNLEIKDNKIRYRINNIIFENNLSGLVNIKRTYSNFLNEMDSEEKSLIANRKLYNEETKERIKKKYEYEANNANNNLRDLISVEEFFKKQILLNENLITEKLNQKDEW